jgi:hypothetical protein
MKVVKWLLPSLIGLVLVAVCADLLLRPNFNGADFTGLGGHIASALMKSVTKNLDGSPVDLIDPKSAEVYSRAGEIGMAAARLVGPPPRTSLELPSIEAGKRVDPWGHPFCLMNLQDQIAVISQGAKQDGPGCGESEKEIRAARRLRTGILYRSPQGAWTVFVSRTNPPMQGN